MEENAENGQTEITNLNLGIDEIDVKEFDLPEVTSPQTLESILNEPDDDVFIDELVPLELLQGEEQGDTVSVGSSDLDVNRTPTKRRHKKSIRYAQHGSILRHVVLKGISAQLMSAADRVDAGMPTAIAVSSLIAVGTSHGLVLVFVPADKRSVSDLSSDPKQVMKWCLGSTVVGAKFGAVSALSFNRDCTRLLAGFAKGQITMWDLTNGKLLRTITDAHPPGTAILHVKFTDESTLAVCSDSGGSVFELEFKRLIGVRTCDSRCLFSGSRGEVCTIEPLHMNYTVPDHPMRDVVLLAMASLSKVLIVTLRPTLKVMFTHALKGDAATLPLLAWQFVIIQVSEKDRVIDPVLAFARDQTIYFFQVVCHGPENIKFVGLQKTQLPYKLLNLVWMNSRTMVAIDTSERAHVIDVRSEEELEVLDLVDVQLAYATSFYKSLATGGNVSQALAYAGERACYHSMVSFNSQLVLQGTKSVHVMTMRNWQDRLDVLAKQGKHQDALALALSFFNNKAKGVVGLGGGSHRRRSVVADRMLDLLLEYVDSAMTRGCPKHGKLEQLERYYQDVVPVCVDYCLALDMLDILFERIYERFSSDVIARGVFLECLEPYILMDKLVAITPVVMKDFVDHYEEKGMLQNVEACIVHLNIASLDIHQVVSLCWAHGLYDAILYIYNKGMHDYTTPLEELLSLLTAALSTGKQLTDRQIKLGNKLLVYISCCLAGRAYPLGEIPDEHVVRVKDEVFQTVSCLHTKNRNEDEPVYPHLKTLLKFDTREFFNVLALAFEEEEFKTEEGQDKKQRLVDILLQIMVESVGFTPTQVGTLFTFLARQMAKPENTVFVNRVLFEQVLEFLSNPHDESRHEERQQAVVELLNTGVLDTFEEDKLLTLAENAKFLQVCEMLYEKRREYDKIFSCYWRDPARQERSFEYVEQLMMSPAFTSDEKKAVENKVMSQIKELVAVDARQTAQLVLVAFSRPLAHVTKQLSDNEETLYAFLQGVFEYRDASGSAVYVERNIHVEPDLHELYIELMCKHNPPGVATYLKVADGYRLEETLEICRRFRIPDATAFLLEKTGDVQGAFNIFLEALQSKLKKIEQKLTEHEGDDLTVSWSNVNAVLLIIVQLCQRNSPKVDEAQRELLWFPLLDTMMTPQRRLKDRINKQSMDEYRELTRHVLNSMMGYIALPAILQKILQDPSYSTGKFGEIRELLLGMLDTYNYEKTLLNTCNSLVAHDLHVHLASFTLQASRACVPREERCALCSKQFLGSGADETVVCFRCGHGYHAACLKSVGSSYKLEGETHWMCYICNSSRRGRLPSATSRLQRLLSSGGGSFSGALGAIARPGGAPALGVKSAAQEVDMDPGQIQAMENLRRVQKTQSRLAILTELSRPETSRPGASGSRGLRSGPSLLQNEEFQLRLAPPPAPDDDAL